MFALHISVVLVLYVLITDGKKIKFLYIFLNGIW